MSAVPPPTWPEADKLTSDWDCESSKLLLITGSVMYVSLEETPFLLDVSLTPPFCFFFEVFTSAVCDTVSNEDFLALAEPLLLCAGLPFFTVVLVLVSDPPPDGGLLTTVFDRKRDCSALSPPPPLPCCLFLMLIPCGLLVMTGLLLGEDEGDRWVEELLLRLTVVGKRSFLI